MITMWFRPRRGPALHCRLAELTAGARLQLLVVREGKHACSALLVPHEGPEAYTLTTRDGSWVLSRGAELLTELVPFHPRALGRQPWLVALAGLLAGALLARSLELALTPPVIPVVYARSAGGQLELSRDPEGPGRLRQVWIEQDGQWRALTPVNEEVDDDAEGDPQHQRTTGDGPRVRR